MAIYPIKPLDRWIALVLGLISLGLYARTLAPDILYGDSGEFQTLAYTLGHTHSTGYPVYLFLARLVGFLPVGNLAWRINLFSAISAAITLAFVYLLGRSFTHNRWGPIAASLALMLSYTFWSQAIIAEVYTPALAFCAVSMYGLMQWQANPEKRGFLLFIAGILIGSGVGVHAAVGLLAPGSVVLVIWVLFQNRNNDPLARRISIQAVGGTIAGIIILTAGFLFIDLNDPLSSFYRVMLEPSRSLWGLTLEDLDSPAERIYYTFTGLQWRDAMFPEDLNLIEEFFKFQSRFTEDEFSTLFYLVSLAGLIILLSKYQRPGWIVLITVLSLLFHILNYQPPDKYVFYLPIYVVLCFTAGSGFGMIVEWLAKKMYLKDNSILVLNLILFTFFFLSVCAPYFGSRWEAIKTGVAGFVKEDYVFPAKSLNEPRAIAILYNYALPKDATLIMDWRALYATLFVAHVEKKNPGLRVLEAMPHGNQGRLAESMVSFLNSQLQAGFLVFSNNLYGDIEAQFRVKEIEGSGLYQIYLK